MTREEAREWFKNALNNNDFFSETEDAFKIAIESLSADTVSRSQYQGLLNAIEKVYVEVVRCKDCIHRQTYECPMYREEWHTIDEGDGYIDDDLVIFDWTVDDGYCHLGDTEVEQTEQQTEEEMLREQCQAFIDIVNHTEKGDTHEID